MSAHSTHLVLFFASILVLQSVIAQSDEEAVAPRYVRTPKAKFIRFGRAGGAKFIRFGKRSGANTWDESVLEEADDLIRDEMAKRAGAKFIRFG